MKVRKSLASEAARLATMETNASIARHPIRFATCVAVVWIVLLALMKWLGW